NTCGYGPMYNGSTSIPHEFAVGNGDLLTLSWDAAFWVTSYVANQAYHQYSKMIDDIRKVQKAEEATLEGEVDKFIAELPSMDAATARQRLNAHSADASKRYVKRYKDLGDYLLVKYMDGNIKREKDGKFERTPEGMPVSPIYGGYDERYYRSIADQTGDHLLIK
ncbi:MAG: dipeptidase, partial [Duncaniella sp.]|nr:dipeptidase [Duncaniella sp.]